MNEASDSLFERLGGATGVSRLVDDFYGRVLGDPELRPFFAGVPLDKLLRMQKEFFGAALGGPADYSGQDLARVHFGRGITRTHLTRFVEHLLATMQVHDIDSHSADQVVQRIARYSHDIVGEGQSDG